MTIAVSPEIVRQILRYDPAEGKLFWLPRLAELFPDGRFGSERACASWNARYAHRQAFTTLHASGYLMGDIFNRKYLAHRVVWALVMGVWPTADVDHKNGVRSDNRWDNLREATRTENNRNTSSRAGSTSQYLGVSWDKDCGRWRAIISVNGTNKHIGSFPREDAAALAYDAAARKHHGKFAKLNFEEGGA